MAVRGFHDDRLASVLNNLGLLRLEQGRAAEAEQLLLRAAGLYTRCGADCARAAAAALRNVGLVRRLQGRFASAEQAVRQGLATIRDRNDGAADRARLMDELGWIYLHYRQPHAAVDHFRRAIDELGDVPAGPDYRPQVYQSLATAHLVAGRLRDAEQACFHALELLDIEANPQLAAAVYLRLGGIFSELDQYKTAEDYLNRTLALLSTSSLTSPFELWPVHHEIAKLETRRGKYARCLACLPARHTT